MIAVDAYRPPYIPFHLTTVEFFELARDRLAEDGVVAVNVGRTSTDYSLVDAMAATMQAVFPSVYIVDAPDGPPANAGRRQHAGEQPRDRHEEADVRWQTCRPICPRSRATCSARWLRKRAASARIAAPPPGTPVFTDDRAPVEQVVHALVFRYMLGDLELDQRACPASAVAVRPQVGFRRADRESRSRPC